MKKLLLVGKPFHALETSINQAGLSYEKVSLEEAADFDLRGFGSIVLIGVNILLNTSQINLIKRLYSEAESNTVFYTWNHEPFWDYRVSDVEYLFGRKTYIFNCYNRKVHTSIFSHYFGVGGILWRGRTKRVELPDKEYLRQKFERIKNKNKIVCAYATCFHDFRLDIPHSIVRLRNDTIKIFYDNQLCDVYGRNWTGNWKLTVTEESRAGFEGKSWGQIKVEHSRENYLFSICIENSLIENYCTEKFAQAIESHLIPIYVFGNGLENFINPENAIEIDGSKESLYKAIELIETMHFEEYYRRLEILTNEYNTIISQVDLVDLERSKPAKILLKQITNNL